MHDMTAADHVLTVLPLFHVGGLNIQTTPALQLGATVTLHRALRAGRDAGRARARPADADRAGAGDHAGRDRASALGGDRLDSLRALTTGSTQVPQRLVDAFTARGVPVLQVYGSTETCPIAVYTRARRRLARRARPACPASCARRAIVDDAGNEVAPGVAGEVVVRGPNVFFEYWGNAAATAETLARGLVSFRRHRHARRRRAFLHPRPQEEHDHLRRREHLSGRGRARAASRIRTSPKRAVIGRADPKWQEVPVAYVVRRAGRDGRRARARSASAGAARALQGAARIRVRRCAAAQRDGQGAAFRAARDATADAHRGPRRRQRLVRGGGRHGARRPRGAAVAARRARRSRRTTRPAARSW